MVIPGKLALASATRNPGIQKRSGYRRPPVWRERTGWLVDAL